MHGDPMGAGRDAPLRRVDDARYPETPGVPKQRDLVQVDAEASHKRSGQRSRSPLIPTPACSRDTNLSPVLERPSQRSEVQLTVGVEDACRSVIRTRSADHVQARIGPAHGWILIWEKQDLIGRPDRPGAPRNGVMGQHVDYTAAPLLDIEVLGAKSPGEVPLQCAGGIVKDAGDVTATRGHIVHDLSLVVVARYEGGSVTPHAVEFTNLGREPSGHRLGRQE